MRRHRSLIRSPKLGVHLVHAVRLRASLRRDAHSAGLTRQPAQGGPHARTGLLWDRGGVVLVLVLSYPQFWRDHLSELREVLDLAALRACAGQEGPIRPGLGRAKLAFEPVVGNREPDEDVVVSDPGWWSKHMDEMASALHVAARVSAGDTLEDALNSAAEAFREIPRLPRAPSDSLKLPWERAAENRPPRGHDR